MGFVQVQVAGPAAFLQPQQREVRPQENPRRVPGAPQGPGQGQGQGEGQREGEGELRRQGRVSAARSDGTGAKPGNGPVAFCFCNDFPLP